jgi:hypothetical protein
MLLDTQSRGIISHVFDGMELLLDTNLIVRDSFVQRIPSKRMEVDYYEFHRRNVSKRSVHFGALNAMPAPDSASGHKL